MVDGTLNESANEHQYTRMKKPNRSKRREEVADLFCVRRGNGDQISNLLTSFATIWGSIATIGAPLSLLPPVQESPLRNRKSKIANPVK
jgi:hypothetical protein